MSIKAVVSDYVYVESDDEIYYVPDQTSVHIPGRPKDATITKRLTVPEVLQFLRQHKEHFKAVKEQ